MLQVSHLRLIFAVFSWFPFRGQSKPSFSRRRRIQRGHVLSRTCGSAVNLLNQQLFVLEKPWRLGIPLLPNMRTITLSRFQTSIVFFSNRSHLIYTFIFFYCHSSYFYLAFFVYISSTCILIFYPSKAVE